jgi:hypothetical protein
MRRWHLCQCCAGILARITLASSQSLHCHCRRRHAGVLARILMASSLSLRWHCHLCRPTLPPALQTGICPTMMQLQHVRVRGVIVVVIFLAHGLIAVPGIIPRNLALMVRPLQRWHLCRCCASRHVLASSPASPRH